MRFFPTIITAVSSLSFRSSVPWSYARHNLGHRAPSRTSTLTAAAILPPRLNSSSLKAASSEATSVASESDTKKPIPAILLAGFLGSGKTSTLKNLLENKQNIKVGTIVNDVASVNIDAKLISNSDSNNSNRIESMADGVVELQNGCACCTLADELIASVERLTEGGKRDLDAIVIELSGVADPVAVHENWDQAKRQGHPTTQYVDLKRTVTLVDSSTFGTDWYTWDLAGDREDWVESGEDHSAVRKVPELLAEQVEAADLLLINKIDLAGKDQVKVANGLARGLNEKAAIMEVEFGNVDPEELLGKTLGGTRVDSHDHTQEDTGEFHSHSHSHDHSSDNSEIECTDASHSHSHEHSHSHDQSECLDPECTDTSHNHSHSHKHQAEASTVDHLGISSFVYKASVPFNSQRLLALLTRWPIPIKDSLDLDLVVGLGKDDIDDAVDNKAFAGVLRSKGFCWMAPTNWSNSAENDVWRHETAMYWSHAGKHFGITSAGKWWGCLTKEQIKPYFANNMKEYDRIMTEDWVSEEWGDRRQELVFIGSKLDEAGIRAALDNCLCTEEEMADYRAEIRSIQATSV